MSAEQMSGFMPSQAYSSFDAPVYTRLRGAAHSAARTASCSGLIQRLNHTRACLLRVYDDYAAHLDERLWVPCHETVNLPLWELGHIAWFQERWTLRNPACWEAWHDARAHTALNAFIFPQTDLFYDSSAVAHATRWHLPLPSKVQTLGYLQRVLDSVLERLSAPESDADLYFFKWVLFHEQMHLEAALYMADDLDIPMSSAVLDAIAQTVTEPSDVPQVQFSAAFAFDNEHSPSEGHGSEPHTVEGMDDAPVSWAKYLAFAQETAHTLPHCVENQNGQWFLKQWGRWSPLSMTSAAHHLSWHDAKAYCAWAQRRLPTECEWTDTVCERGLQWGEVWEWTDSDFLPPQGFVAHPYKDYSEPWFGTRKVLKGASRLTCHDMADVRYRNFFTPERRDVYSGFRTCPL